MKFGTGGNRLWNPSNVPEMAKILKVKKETPTIKSFVLDREFDVKPGQFFMLWLPGIDEKPFSFSSKKPFCITVKKVGEFTGKMHALKKGKIGIRGPYGNGFSIKGNEICIIAGGVGIAPLMPVLKECTKKRKKTTVILGAKTKNELLFVDRIKKTNAELIITTDDGSCGEKCFACDALEVLLKKERFDCVYTCGPESMMKKVADLCLREKIECQVNLERYMKCGIGICGQCVLDPSGLRVCKDGPVFNARRLADTEFGKYRRDASGAREETC